jgi:DNA-binding beta-propeller fold protein YncE
MSKTIRLTVPAILALVGMCVSALAQVGVVNAPRNPGQLAILHWYPVNKVTKFSVGQLPDGLAFDGANVWVANQQDNTVTKLRANDGKVLGTFGPLGNGPSNTIFDGENIWISCFQGNEIDKVRASDGAILGRFVQLSPEFLAFDGTYIWMTNGELTENVRKMRASDGQDVGVFSVGPGTGGILFDGANIWVTVVGDGLHKGTLVKMRPSDGAVLGTSQTGFSPWSLAFDGANVWVTNLGGANVTKIRASDGAVLGTFNVPGNDPISLAFDGANIWVVNQLSSNFNQDSTLTKMRASDGVVLATFPVPTTPDAVMFDGTSIWLTDTSDAAVSKF